MNRFRLLMLLFLSAVALAVPSLAPAQSSASGKAYCYKAGDSTLRLEVAGNGQAAFQLDSWQGEHNCGGAGKASPAASGWVYEERLDGGPCRMEILIEDGGIRLTDAEWRCKATLCGQRAVIDGLSFPRSSQVDCASLPAQ